MKVFFLLKHVDAFLREKFSFLRSDDLEFSDKVFFGWKVCDLEDRNDNY
jgi:hypothetical protein